MTPLSKTSQTHANERKVTLKTIAERLGLTPGTVSAALNNSPAARSISGHTKNRIIQAAQELNYRPNFFARTLRLKRTYTIGVIAEGISSFQSQSARKKVRPVVERFRSFDDAILGVLGDGTRGRGVVQAG